MKLCAADGGVQCSLIWDGWGVFDFCLNIVILALIFDLAITIQVTWGPQFMRFIHFEH